MKGDYYILAYHIKRSVLKLNQTQSIEFDEVRPLNKIELTKKFCIEQNQTFDFRTQSNERV